MNKDVKKALLEIVTYTKRFDFFVGHGYRELNNENNGVKLSVIAQAMLRDRDYLHKPTKTILLQEIKKGRIPTPRRLSTTIKWRVRRGLLNLKAIKTASRKQRKMRKNTPPLFDTGFLTKNITSKYKSKKRKWRL